MSKILLQNQRLLRTRRSLILMIFSQMQHLPRTVLLIPSGPVNEDELESYEAVYHYQPPKSKINLNLMINEKVT